MDRRIHPHPLLLMRILRKKAKIHFHRHRYEIHNHRTKLMNKHNIQLSTWKLTLCYRNQHNQLGLASLFLVLQREQKRREEKREQEINSCFNKSHNRMNYKLLKQPIKPAWLKRPIHPGPIEAPDSPRPDWSARWITFKCCKTDYDLLEQRLRWLGCRETHLTLTSSSTTSQI